MGEDIKNRFLNLIMDNGVSLSLAVAFCFVVYYIVHQQNQELMAAIYQLRADKKELRAEERELIQDIIECYKLKKY
tara:strand:+ start:1964 stop:2191 length:228 start_codon:yes stop_codon:yes gene_type:complete